MHIHIYRHTQSAFPKILLFSNLGPWHNSQFHITSQQSFFHQCFVQAWVLGELKQFGPKSHPQTELRSTPRTFVLVCNPLGKALALSIPQQHSLWLQCSAQRTFRFTFRLQLKLLRPPPGPTPDHTPPGEVERIDGWCMFIFPSFLLFKNFPFIKSISLFIKLFNSSKKLP